MTAASSPDGGEWGCGVVGVGDEELDWREEGDGGMADWREAPRRGWVGRGLLDGLGAGAGERRGMVCVRALACGWARRVAQPLRGEMRITWRERWV